MSRRGEFEVSAEAMRSFRSLRPNEVSHMRQGLETVKSDPMGDGNGFQLLSQRSKHYMYRYRTSVGFIVYNVSKVDKSVIVIGINPFKKAANGKVKKAQ
jgi:mRNA-degrading endonuclease RelE of RelBE toxin-antitoxin system